MLSCILPDPVSSKLLSPKLQSIYNMLSLYPPFSLHEWQHDELSQFGVENVRQLGFLSPFVFVQTQVGCFQQTS